MDRRRGTGRYVACACGAALWALALGCEWGEDARTGKADPVDATGNAAWRVEITPADEATPGYTESTAWPDYAPPVAPAPASTAQPTKGAAVASTAPPRPRPVWDENPLPWEVAGRVASDRAAGTAVPSQVVVPVPESFRGPGPSPIRRVPVDIALSEIDTETGLWAATAGTEDAVERPRTADEWLQLGWDRKAAGDLDGAEEAFARAGEAGADAHVVAMELGYLAVDREDLPTARDHFRDAKIAAQTEARQARDAMRGVEKPLWFDLYAEGYGWHRFVPDRSTNFVPMLRLRALWSPFDEVDLEPYLFVQASRDFSSRGADGPDGAPLIYADNSLMFGVGVQLSVWKRRIGLFAQIGPAFNLLRNDGRKPVMLDFRAGAFLFADTARCRPAAQESARDASISVDPCAEVYAEAVYVSRFDHNLQAMARGRYAIGWLVTGPVAWQPIAEVRVFKDTNNDYWNNLVDGGVGHRWRLLQPFGLDLMLSVHVGSYFGLENVDPAPDPLYFSEFRFQTSTYIAF